MRINIDIDKSIKKKRLIVIYKGFIKRLDSWISVFYIVALIIIGLIFPIILSYQSISQNRTGLIRHILIFSPLIIIGILSLYSLINDNRLLKFKGVNQTKNREILSQILAEKFGVIIHKSDCNTLRIYKKATCWKWGLRIIVIFDNQDVLMNISRFNMKALKSPFHSWFDFLKMKSIVRDFNKIAEIT